MFLTVSTWDSAVSTNLQSIKREKRIGMSFLRHNDTERTNKNEDRF